MKGFVVATVLFTFVLIFVGIPYYCFTTFSERDGSLIGQAKKVTTSTPILCPRYNELDISLGIIRNGTGSISGQDIWVTVPNPKDFEIAKEAAERGAIVKVYYDTRRWFFCTDELLLSGIEIVE